MTSIKIIRERETETRKRMEIHEALSASYSVLQQHLDAIGYSVTHIGVEDAYSILMASGSSAAEAKGRQLALFAVSNAEDLEPLASGIKGEKSGSNGNTERPIIVVSVRRGSNENAQSRFEGIGADMVWEVSGDGVAVKAVSGSPDDFPEFSLLFSENGARVINNFPHPFIGEADPLIKFHFLSMNNARTGKAVISDIINETASLAYTLSVNQSREAIKSDLLDLVADMDKAGIITARGNEIYFPKNIEKFRRMFIRRYWDYVEKIGKRTLFDFEAPF